MEPDSGIKVKKFPFSRKERLRLRKVFEFVFSEGLKTATRELAMWSCLPDAGGGGTQKNRALPHGARAKKLGLVVGRKTGGAVRRNRLKRLLREAFRLSKDGLKDGAHIIVYPKIGCRIKNLSQAREALGALWARAKIAQ